MDDAPDLAAPIEAWRTWLVVQTPAGLRLASVMYATAWQPLREMAAACRPHVTGWPGLVDTGRHDHESPAEHCRCGIYGATDLSEAVRYLETVGPVGDPVAWSVIGRVALWGTVIEAAAGYRAAFAYPASIYVPARRLIRRRSGREPSRHLTPGEVAGALTAYGVAVHLLRAVTTFEVAEGLQAAAA
jgi:hypothetical protein